MTDTVPASPLPPAQPPNVSADLYKAVIGPVNQAVYLRRFAEFDRLGKTRPVWHWAAFASALNWLLFRGMWGAALIYAAVMLAALLGLLGIGRLAYDFSDPTAQLLLVGFLGLTSVLAGLYAHAAYYQFCKKKIVQTVGLASSMQDAGKRLRSEASTRKRLVVLAGLNATVLGLLGWGFIAAQNTRLMPVAHTATRESAQQPEGDQSAAPASSPIQPVTSEPVPRPVTPPELVASAPVADSTVPVLKAEAPAPTPALAPAASESAAVAVAKPALKPASAVKPVADPSSTRYFVQVGVFAVENNALTLQEKLEAEGFRVHTLGMQTPRGVMIQVRVGPFDTKALADDEAAKLKALDLPIYIFKLKS